MVLKKEKYSEHFWSNEFDYVEPENSLLAVLEELRKKTGHAIIITSGPRTPKKHIEIYKDLEERGKLGDKKWYEAIPWSSRHLPAFGKKLRAVDINAIKIENGIKSRYSGNEIYEFLKEIEIELDIKLGIGIGKTYCHIDSDREKSAVWYYS